MCLLLKAGLTYVTQTHVFSPKSYQKREIFGVFFEIRLSLKGILATKATIALQKIYLHTPDIGYIVPCNVIHPQCMLLNKKARCVA